ncbi:MAG: hypothetical protein E6I55_07625 [Chloroflexi bacterium]|nr:MAG: hypothetical protein E6I55_07625 [Chloroflexota bacterium]
MEGGSQTIQPAIAAAAPRSTVATRIRTWWLTWQRSCVIGVAGAACLALLTELIGLVAAFGGRFPVELQQHPESAVGIWLQWDANWFTSIVRLGYAANTHVPVGPVTYSAAAFPPGYPALMRGVSSVLPISPLAAGLLISGVAAVALLILVVAYSDSVIAAAGVWAFYAARRGHWVTAGVLTAVATVTKIEAVIIVVPLAVEYMAARHWDWRKIRGGLVALVAIPIVGLAGVAAYFQATLHDPLAFVKAQGAWGHTLAHPWSTFTQDIRNIVGLHWFERDTGVAYTLDVVAYGLLLLTTIYAIRTMRRSYWIFMVLMLLLLGFSGTLTSTERHLLLVFPMFIALARIAHRSAWIERGLVVVGLPLLVYSVARFATGHWVN